MEFNFNKQPSSRINSFGVGYDYGSVMHYGERAFSRNGSPTIRSKQAGAQLGQRRGLSAKDKLQLQQRYGCTTNPTVQTTVQTTVEPTQPSGTVSNYIFSALCFENGTHCKDLRAVLFENNIGQVNVFSAATDF
jgi:hypothetical protein